MSDEREYDSLTLVGYSEPDYSIERNDRGEQHSVELPGLYRVGFLADGHFVEIFATKAGALNSSAAQAARKRRDESQSQSPEQ
jgi:hypothetical protein